MFERGSTLQRVWRIGSGLAVILNAGVVAYQHVSSVQVLAVCVAAFFFAISSLLRRFYSSCQRAGKTWWCQVASALAASTY